jgi:threonine/homoserine/homoserine lactone efflux protein
LSIAAPVGPIGVLCIRRTLAHGRKIGLISGLGAASADAAYGFLAAFGLTFITNLLIDGELALKLLGGAFLMYLGVRTFLARPADTDDVPHAERVLHPRGAYLSTFALTITNPATIIAFSAIFLSLDVSARAGGYGGAALVVLGVFTGSALWWLALSAGVSTAQRFASGRFMLWVNRASGGVLVAFGVLAAASAFAMIL